MAAPVSDNVAQQPAQQPQQYKPVAAVQNPPLPPNQHRDIQEQILETLQQITLLLQLLGLAVGALFGAFAILSWKLGDGANSLSSDANSLAGASNGLSQEANCLSGVANWMSLASFCAAATNASFCQPFQSDFKALGDSIYDNIASRASRCFTGGGTTTSSVPSSAKPSAAGGLLAGIIIGSILAVTFAFGALYLPYQTYKMKFRQQRKPQRTAL